MVPIHLSGQRTWQRRLKSGVHLSLNDKLEHDNQAIDMKNQGENIAAVYFNDEQRGSPPFAKGS